MSTEPTQKQKAEAAIAALQAYQVSICAAMDHFTVPEISYESEDLEFAIQDLLSDMRHLVVVANNERGVSAESWQFNVLDFSDINDAAYERFAEEDEVFDS